MTDPIITPRRREDFFDSAGNPTIRFIRWIELVSGQTNSSTLSIENNTDTLASDNNLNAQVLRLQAQIGSGQPLTIDTTGFTVDTTKQTTDRTEV